ncbi:hypothetical protein DSO57_1008927 [Entomophthora muscae]|uniref:Uncharacterized protein n=1 Tax=Entomophthora muscae TaxID=34485 RepID=A0ACC2T6X7_9FUNG|nr:hypothetical protein DSO57_1008927 [Entomophthora muscae]
MQEMDSPITGDAPKPASNHRPVSSHPPREAVAVNEDPIDSDPILPDESDDISQDLNQTKPLENISPQNQTKPLMENISLQNQTKSQSIPAEPSTTSPVATPSSVPSVGAGSKCRDKCITLKSTSASDMLSCYSDCKGKPESLYVPTSISERAYSTALAKSEGYTSEKTAIEVAQYDDSGSIRSKSIILPIAILLGYQLI